MLSDLIGTIPLLVLASILAFTRLRIWAKGRSAKKIITFFHPYAAGRGGGERVLWAAIDGILGSVDPNNTRVIVYSVDDDRESMMRKRNSTFGLSSQEHDKIVEIKKIFFASLLEPKTWPIATIIGQSVGSVIVLLVALMTSPFSDWPTTFIDTTGCPFTLPVAKLLTGAKTCAYIHYPTMSNDMFSKVAEKRSDFNNSAVYTSSAVLLTFKKTYYKFFLFMYRLCGYSVDVTVCNSGWTASRIRDVWGRKDVAVLYPPAAIGNGEQITKIGEESRQLAILSLAQFRPEKRQDFQIGIFSKILKRIPHAKFWIMGGCRNAEDELLIESLKKFAFDQLAIPRDRIDFVVNADWSEISTRLRMAKCAIHTMVDEHFGISILEFLEAKIPLVCHRSGGPETDILLPDEKYGFLASQEEEYVDKVVTVLQRFDSDEIRKMRINAFNSLSRFMNDQQFGAEFSKLCFAEK